MQVLVLSCGRTGTNMLLEIMRGNSRLDATPFAEDKYVFQDSRELPSGYLSKCDTVYINDTQQIDDLFNKNPLLRVLFTVRDWRDCAMSKFYRGQPGQDNNIIADDATVEGCIEDLKWMETIHDYLTDKYFRNTLTIKMEDIILNFDRTIEGICGFCALPFERENMISFTERYRNNFKSDRYKDIDKSQVKLYKKIDAVYEGFFTEDRNKKEINEVFERIKPLLLKYGYEGDYTI